MQSRLRVLGSSGGFPVLGLPCSGYRFTGGGQDILLDCGPGIAGALFADIETCPLDCVIISHMHPDHVLDLVPLGYGLMTEWICNGRTKPLRLRVPTGGREFLKQFSDLFGHRNWRFGNEARGAGHAALRDTLAGGGDWFLTVFDIEEYEPGDSWTEGGIAISTARASHSIPTAVIRLDVDGQSVAYTGDTRWRGELAALAADATLLLADAHLSSDNSPGGAHMSPREAGRLARLAGVETLVLCHLGSPRDADIALSDAALEFAGPIRLAMRDREFFL